MTVVKINRILGILGITWNNIFIGYSQAQQSIFDAISSNTPCPLELTDHLTTSLQYICEEITGFEK